MNKTSLIIAAVIILIIAAGGLFFMNNKYASPSDSAEIDNMTAEDNNDSLVSLRDLMNLGRDQKCSYSFEDETGTAKGTVYISGERMRTDFSGSYNEGESYEGSMINDGKYIYSWTSAMEQGMKMPIPEESMEQPETMMNDSENPTQNYVDMSREMDYDCGSWNADNNTFVPPADIEFVDYSQMMNQMKQSNDTKAAQCSACDSLQGEAQTSCKQALGC